ncbi:MAG: hypothetical protein K8S62_10405 [Candidatus Sabulitectum sp.]|nr:hypothetical protein [Candidatus Sabulitectum sp.]
MNKRFSVAVLIALVFSSCNLFEPRTPEDPSNEGVVWLDPTSPDIVVENIQSTLNGGSTLYMDCFTESFVFYADSNDINEYSGYNFDDWTKAVENSTVSLLFTIVPADSIIAAEFLIDTGNPDPAAPSDSVTIYRNYTISIPQSYHSGTGTPAAGIAELHMVENDGLWAIQEWHDVRHVETSLVTWAVAKAYYR